MNMGGITGGVSRETKKRGRTKEPNMETNMETNEVLRIEKVARKEGEESDDEQPMSTGAKGKKIIVILDQAKLETVKTRKGDFQLLNCDDHRDLMKKNKKDPAMYRPDIAHQELLALIDSPLNKAGKLKVFIRTEKNVLIEVNPAIRIPRTFKRFGGLMVQLLHKMKIKVSFY